MFKSNPPIKTKQFAMCWQSINHTPIRHGVHCFEASYNPTVGFSNEAVSKMTKNEIEKLESSTGLKVQIFSVACIHEE